MKKPTKNMFNVPVVYHIGYQGRDLAGFLEVLKSNHVDVLVDLREKPFSRVKGFSKNQLGMALSVEGIKYLLRGDKLGGFTLGYNDWLKSLPEIAELASKSTVCIMCMEQNPNECHRKQLIRILEDKHGVVGAAM
ncbi:MAG TPA: DUF488 domain-containing protein [Sedimentisphaerales bacterium]|nr:DUF488 domain-containing protein [Sedimentisphaerales bacterium]